MLSDLVSWKLYTYLAWFVCGRKRIQFICRVPIMVLERTANPWSFIRLVGSNPTLCVEERVTSFRASRTFIDLHLLLAARMILLRTEHDRPAVFG